jgi:CheY-like chemotaxis protein
MKILIVDDEPASAGRLAAEVKAAGWPECYAATSAEEAVEIANHEHGIDVLVTNVFLDGVDGLVLDQAVRDQLPEVRTIFLAGNDVSQVAEGIGSRPVLQKPVDTAALIAEISRASAAGKKVQTPPPEPDPLVGRALGTFRIDEVAGEDSDGPFYRAMQTSIGREVEFHTLSRGRATDSLQVARFLDDARAKANVHHPALLSVFEAGDCEGIYFYASEVPQGATLESLAARGERMDNHTAIQLLHAVSEVMVHLGHHKTPHKALKPRHVVVDHRGRTRIINIVTHAVMDTSALDEMRQLAQALQPLLPEVDETRAVRELLTEMQAEVPTVKSWTALLYEVNRCASGNGPTHAYKMDAAARAGVEAVSAARQRGRLVRLLVRTVVALVVLAGLGYVGWLAWPSKLGNPAFENMILIPGGEYISPTGEKVQVPPFYIGEHEVTIGQYADFLAWVRRYPSQAASLALSDLPPPTGHSLIPAGWADTPSGPGYFSIARKGGTYQGATLTLASPVFGVDWFDAYAYALWKGRSLPTSEEWGRAATGDKGLRYPWGNQWIRDNANLNAPDKKWVAVNAIPGDRSPYGVIGMAGNVSEFTLSMNKNEKTGALTPVICGGNWSDKSLDIQRRMLNLSPSQSSPTVGFRIASDVTQQ